MRISQFLAKKYNISRKFAIQLVKTGRVKNSQTAVKKDGVAEGNYTAEYEQYTPIFDLSDYLIKYCCDKKITYLYKPPFMHIERLNPSEDLCMTDIIKDMDGYRLITRLDYGVDGIVAAIKDEIIVTDEQKKYFAWVKGNFKNEVSGYWTIDAKKRKSVSVSFHRTGHKYSYMRIAPVTAKKECTLVEISLSKAARHQIRAALAYLGHPIADDALYGDEDNVVRIMLHCAEVSINNNRCVSPYADAFMSMQL
jgi:23S rRNA pseudouridine1911/1915/1917 synthase